ncbi:type II toxin-antitoxin system RelE/ParE family toxin [Rudanella paleaurantiibacter]|uniref:Type II toxin-antitoxin system RelE/ParE family toxin n=1 Tax=Rudanella paleaurantiibacter TaxID=2614655 RepID=A0A7J5U6K8_9BACT|nr:type II toxin-antitoxin system RelE/ParE family toxin [Rudanella paleaurantiibacter]KAB7733227.1 type II toxin-antitoxin system RelE/ParE family toxin [Rudanella paleaurantiibacter]
MALQIIWTDEAKEEFRQTVAYLLDAFGDEVTEKHTDKLYHTLETLSQMPFIGKRHAEVPAIRQQVVRPYTVVCYTVVEEFLVVVNLKDSRKGGR